jgi:hypothetical protein
VAAAVEAAAEALFKWDNQGNGLAWPEVQTFAPWPFGSRRRR